MSDEVEEVSEQNRLIPVRKVGIIFSVNTHQVRLWIKSGDLKGRMIKNRWYVTNNEVQRFAKSQYGDDNDAA